jgi:hypothetical protein
MENILCKKHSTLLQRQLCDCKCNSIKIELLAKCVHTCRPMYVHEFNLALNKQECLINRPAVAAWYTGHRVRRK